MPETYDPGYDMRDLHEQLLDAVRDGSNYTGEELASLRRAALSTGNARFAVLADKILTKILSINPNFSDDEPEDPTPSI